MSFFQLDVALNTLTIHRYTQLQIMCKIAKDNDDELTISLMLYSFCPSLRNVQCMCMEQVGDRKRSGTN